MFLVLAAHESSTVKSTMFVSFFSLLPRHMNMMMAFSHFRASAPSQVYIQDDHNVRPVFSMSLASTPAAGENR